MRFGYKCCALIVRYILKLLFGLEARGREKIPMRGRVIIAANHRSYLDPPILGSMLWREVRYLAKEELFKIPVLNWIISYLGAIPIKRSKLDLEALRRSTEILENGEALLVFPEGHRSRDGKLQQGLGGVGYLASQTNTDVYPVYIRNSRGSFRRIFKRQKIKVFIGDSIRLGDLPDADHLSKRQIYMAISDEIMKHISAMEAANK